MKYITRIKKLKINDTEVLREDFESLDNPKITIVNDGYYNSENDYLVDELSVEFTADQNYNIEVTDIEGVNGIVLTTEYSETSDYILDKKIQILSNTQTYTINPSLSEYHLVDIMIDNGDGWLPIFDSSKTSYDIEITKDTKIKLQYKVLSYSVTFKLTNTNSNDTIKSQYVKQNSDIKFNFEKTNDYINSISVKVGDTEIYQDDVFEYTTTITEPVTITITQKYPSCVISIDDEAVTNGIGLATYATSSTTSQSIKVNYNTTDNYYIIVPEGKYIEGFKVNGVYYDIIGINANEIPLTNGNVIITPYINSNELVYKIVGYADAFGKRGYLESIVLTEIILKDISTASLTKTDLVTYIEKANTIVNSKSYQYDENKNSSIWTTLASAYVAYYTATEQTAIDTAYNNLKSVIDNYSYQTEIIDVIVYKPLKISEATNYKKVTIIEEAELYTHYNIELEYNSDLKDKYIFTVELISDYKIISSNFLISLYDYQNSNLSCLTDDYIFQNTSTSRGGFVFEDHNIENLKKYANGKYTIRAKGYDTELIDWCEFKANNTDYYLRYRETLQSKLDEFKNYKYTDISSPDYLTKLTELYDVYSNTRKNGTITKIQENEFFKVDEDKLEVHIDDDKTKVENPVTYRDGNYFCIQYPVGDRCWSIYRYKLVKSFSVNPNDENYQDIINVVTYNSTGHYAFFTKFDDDFILPEGAYLLNNYSAIPIVSKYLDVNNIYEISNDIAVPLSYSSDSWDVEPIIDGDNNIYKSLENRERICTLKMLSQSEFETMRDKSKEVYKNSSAVFSDTDLYNKIIQDGKISETDYWDLFDIISTEYNDDTKFHNINFTYTGDARAENGTASQWYKKGSIKFEIENMAIYNQENAMMRILNDCVDTIPKGQITFRIGSSGIVKGTDTRKPYFDYYAYPCDIAVKTIKDSSGNSVSYTTQYVYVECVNGVETETEQSKYIDAYYADPLNYGYTYSKITLDLQSDITIDLGCVTIKHSRNMPRYYYTNAQNSETGIYALSKKTNTISVTLSQGANVTHYNIPELTAYLYNKGKSLYTKAGDNPRDYVKVTLNGEDVTDNVIFYGQNARLIYDIGIPLIYNHLKSCAYLDGKNWKPVKFYHNWQELLKIEYIPGKW